MHDKNTAWVKAGMHGYVDVDDTEFLDIEESPYGDIMHFLYEGKEYSSCIVFGSRPG